MNRGSFGGGKDGDHNSFGFVAISKLLATQNAFYIDGVQVVAIICRPTAANTPFVI